MAVQKKKPMKQNCRNLQVFHWTPQRKQVALLLSLGTYTIEAAAKKMNISERVIYNWKEYPAFIEEIDNLTIKNENFTRAGLLKNCLKGLEIKEHYINEDKNTYLDYIKEIAELQGLAKQKIELEDISKREQTPLTTEVIEAQHTLLKAVANAKHKTDN